MTASAKKGQAHCVCMRVCLCKWTEASPIRLSVPSSSPHTDIHKRLWFILSNRRPLLHLYVSLSVKVCCFFHSINLSPVPFVDLYAPEGGCLLKGTEKRKSFYFLCARHFHEKVKLGTSCELNSRLQSPPRSVKRRPIFNNLSHISPFYCHPVSSALSFIFFQSCIFFPTFPPCSFTPILFLSFSQHPHLFRSLCHSRIRSCWAPRTISLLWCCCFIARET